LALAVGAAAVRGWDESHLVGDGDRALAVLCATRLLLAGVHRAKAAASVASSAAALRPPPLAPGKTRRGCGCGWAGAGAGLHAGADVVVGLYKLNAVDP
jgi:hypothetical protein